MQILDHDIPLEAILDLPSDTAKTHPLLLILHGFTGFKEEAQLACLAGAARDAGFAALRPDLYGHGESGGAFRDHSLDRWLSNIRALLSFAESMTKI
mgnify:FL=1